MAQDQPTVNLKILSPSPELEAGVSFAHLPAATTVKELRARIRDAVPSKPATERMRLIYRGRVVANDADTLLQVFGADCLRETNNLSLHLVLRELPSNSTTSFSPSAQAQAAIAPSLPASLPASPPLQTNPFRSLPTPNTRSQPAHPQSHQPTVPPTFDQHVRQGIPLSQSPARAVPSSVGAAQVPPHPQGHQTPFPPFAQANPQLQGGRTVRQEGIGPNGERWSVTINESNVNIPNLPTRFQQPLLPRPFQLPPGFGLPPRPTTSPPPADVIDRLLPRIRGILQSARQEMENVRALFQAPSGLSPHLAPQLAGPSLPSWRIDRIREHIQVMTQNLDLVERGLAVILADASMSQNADVVLLRQTANELRSHAEEMNRRLASEQGGTTTQNTTPMSGTSSTRIPDVRDLPTTIPTSAPTHTQNAASLTSMDSPPELFILSSPNGPVGILFDSRGTYTTAPMVPTLPFQTFTNQFSHNRQLIAGLGQQITRGSDEFHRQVANIQPTPTQPPAASGEHNPDQAHTQAHNQAQNQNDNAPVNVNPDQNAQPEQDRMLNIAGHLWLIFKLACFVYFFAGGGGFYRPLMLGVIAGLVYLAQIGIFEERFNVVRRHFEAILPVGALAERAVQPRNVDANPNNNHSRNAQAQLRNASVNNLAPEQAAQRLLQQQRDRRIGWIRESMRTVERSFAIFVASLWPGIGERMVHAQEERVRAERVAEEERLRAEEEARAQAAETQQQDEQHKTEVSHQDENETPVASAKGKEKAESAQTS